jgi:hypothetical protein
MTGALCGRQVGRAPGPQRPHLSEGAHRARSDIRQLTDVSGCKLQQHFQRKG